jgi:hypothetical protein
MFPKLIVSGAYPAEITSMTNTSAYTTGGGGTGDVYVKADLVYSGGLYPQEIIVQRNSFATPTVWVDIYITTVSHANSLTQWPGYILTGSGYLGLSVRYITRQNGMYGTPTSSFTIGTL